jgi:hypothetical protein
MNNKILIIVGVVVLVILVGAGGFWGGMAYKAGQVTQVQAQFFEQRGGQSITGQGPQFGQFPQGTPFPGGPQGIFRGGGTTGEVKSIDGDVLTISTAENVTTVNLSSNTTIVKSIEGTISDLQPGMRVMISGEKDSKGNISATQVTIVNDNSSAIPTRTAP